MLLLGCLILLFHYLVKNYLPKVCQYVSLHLSGIICLHVRFWHKYSQIIIVVDLLISLLIQFVFLISQFLLLTVLTVLTMHVLFTDLAWHDDKIFWTTDDEDVFMYQARGHDIKQLDFARHAACVAYDWLGDRIYWSGIKNSNVCHRITSYNVTNHCLAESQYLSEFSLNGIFKNFLFFCFTVL